jgi:cobalt-zinc-cadmium efflux system protein
MQGHAHDAHALGQPDDGHAHSHGLPPGARAEQARRLVVVMVLTALYMFAEVAGGLLTGSLALLADAGHTLSDVASLGLGLFAVWVAQRPASASRTYGHTRVEILAGLAQGVALVAVALVILVEALERIGESPEVNGPGMMLVASGALLANGIGMAILNRGRKQSMNIRGAWLHLASDALGSVGVIAAGAAVWGLGWLWADPAASLAISLLVLFAAWQLLRDAIDILMEAAPGHLDVEEIRRVLVELDDVSDVHDLHVWTIGNQEISLSTHLVSSAHGDPNAVLQRVNALLEHRFAIRHSTVQIELETGTDPSCEGACDREPAPRVAGMGTGRPSR